MKITLHVPLTPQSFWFVLPQFSTHKGFTAFRERKGKKTGSHPNIYLWEAMAADSCVKVVLYLHDLRVLVENKETNLQTQIQVWK